MQQLIVNPDMYHRYLFWYAQKHMRVSDGILSKYAESTGVLTPKGLEDLLSNEISSAYHPNEVKAKHPQPNVQNHYIHFDGEEYGSGELRRLLERIGDSTARFLPKYADMGENSCVYTRTIVVINDDLIHDFSYAQVLAGRNWDGSEKAPACPVAVPEPSWEDLTKMQENINGADPVPQTNLTKEEEPTMNTTTQARRVLDITLMDNDKGIVEASNALVAQFKGIVTQDDDATTIQELIMTEDVAGALKAHNTKRKTLVDEEILNRTGNKVKLREIKLKDLDWIVK